jgi:hypothetical protein
MNNRMLKFLLALLVFFVSGYTYAADTKICFDPYGQCLYGYDNNLTSEFPPHGEEKYYFRYINFYNLILNGSGLCLDADPSGFVTMGSGSSCEQWNIAPTKGSIYFKIVLASDTRYCLSHNGADILRRLFPCGNSDSNGSQEFYYK